MALAGASESSTMRWNARRNRRLIHWSFCPPPRSLINSAAGAPASVQTWAVAVRNKALPMGRDRDPGSRTAVITAARSMALRALGISKLFRHESGLAAKVNHDGLCISSEPLGRQKPCWYTPRTAATRVRKIDAIVLEISLRKMSPNAKRHTLLSSVALARKRMQAAVHRTSVGTRSRARSSQRTRRGSQRSPWLSAMCQCS